MLPLQAGGRTMGLVELYSFAEPRHLDASEMYAALAMASLAATGLEKVRLVQQLRSAADMDLVTDVHNHRYLQERLRQEVARSARSHSPLGRADAGPRQVQARQRPIWSRRRRSCAPHASPRPSRTTSDRPTWLPAMAATSRGPDARHANRARGGRRSARRLGHPPAPAHDERRHDRQGRRQRRPGRLSDGRATSAQLLRAADAAMYAAKRTGGRQVERSSNEKMTLEVSPALRRLIPTRRLVERLALFGVEQLQLLQRNKQVEHVTRLHAM